MMRYHYSEFSPTIREPSLVRLFFGLEIPGNITAKLLQVKTPIAGARWQTDAQLHLTLAFLGEIQEEHTERVRNSARSVIHSSFELEASGLGCFGHADNPKTLWAGVCPETELTRFQQKLAGQLNARGFTLKNPSFKPHITISRFRNNPGPVSGLIGEYQNTRFGRWMVREFVLFESTPGPQGSVYTVLERYPLSAR
ncbi:RNA 2',3'-cyclic phosphodiesterase [Marinobacter sp. VGCF2001]|uniref:RNA 2',3'-cyclic phosphodiesterase n=1 Tax=Marinobacter sp. VGCF2001 TaxID=3417189 RepID=UPI003CEA2809